MAYAEKTSVSVAKTKADIEELIQKAGAGQFVSGYKENVAVIGFSMILCFQTERLLVNSWLLRLRWLMKRSRCHLCCLC